MKIFKPHKLEFIKMEETERHCDKCDCKIEHESSFDCFASSFRVIEGDIYPEGNFTTIKRADFCQECAETIMIALSKNFGVSFYEYDGDDKTTFKKI